MVQFMVFTAVHSSHMRSLTSFAHKAYLIEVFTQRIRTFEKIIMHDSSPLFEAGMSSCRSLATTMGVKQEHPTLEIALALTSGLNGPWWKDVAGLLADCHSWFMECKPRIRESFGQSNDSIVSKGLWSYSSEETYKGAIWAGCANRKVFSTKSYIGNGPANMKENDVLVVLFGHHLPFVLRREGPHWRIIGYAYVHDIRRVISTYLFRVGRLCVEP